MEDGQLMHAERAHSSPTAPLQLSTPSPSTQHSGHRGLEGLWLRKATEDLN